MRNHQELKVWQLADTLVDAVYALTRCLPSDERYALAAQMKRAAVSVPSNIVEGCGRSSDADFERFLSIAAGSAAELEYQLRVAARLWPQRVFATDEIQSANEVKRMLWALMQASRRRRGHDGPGEI